MWRLVRGVLFGGCGRERDCVLLSFEGFATGPMSYYARMQSNVTKGSVQELSSRTSTKEAITVDCPLARGSTVANPTCMQKDGTIITPPPQPSSSPRSYTQCPSPTSQMLGPHSLQTHKQLEHSRVIRRAQPGRRVPAARRREPIRVATHIRAVCNVIQHPGIGVEDGVDKADGRLAGLDALAVDLREKINSWPLHMDTWLIAHQGNDGCEDRRRNRGSMPVRECQFDAVNTDRRSHVVHTNDGRSRCCTQGV